MKRPARVATLLTLGVLLVQAAWVLAVPPFRGLDEFDHAYRAAAVARGQLVPPDTKVVDGRGDYLVVPRALVEAAHPICSSYPYTGRDNCNPAADAGNGLVEVASGAARYNPAFYWVIGKPAQVLDGTANLYALRVLASLLCAALFWFAAYALALAHRTAWPLLGLLVSTTPVFLYSLSLGAPNGVEMTAGLGLWAGLVSLRGRALTLRQERLLIMGTACVAAVLAVPRLLGPGWLVLIVGSALVGLGPARFRELAREHRRPFLAAGAVLGLAVVSALAWDQIAAPNSVPEGDNLQLSDPIGSALARLPEWLLQSIAAFPSRNEPAPAIVYAAGLLSFAIVLTAAGRGMGRRWWLILGGLVAVWIGTQIAITAATYSQFGSVWQGRYALPFAVGIPVLLTSQAERGGQRPPHRLLVAGAVLLVVLGHAVSIVNVFVNEASSSPLAHSAAWLRIPAWALAGLVVLAAVLWLAATRYPEEPERRVQERPERPLQEAATP